jgi:drug/metabolite transporter (DMT)-like permease
MRAIGLMVGAMASFAMADMLIKIAARAVTSAEVILIMGLMGTFLFAVLTRCAGHAVVTPMYFHRAVLARNGFEVVLNVGIISALAVAPLSLVSSISQATPLVVTLAAALILGERVGPRRWIAVIIGLGGVLLILRPGGSEMSVGAIFALISVIGAAGRDVATRLIPRGIPTLQLATWGFSVLIPTGTLMVLLSPGVGKLPDPFSLLILLGATFWAALAYYAITASVRLADVSLVSPFRYTRLIFALFLGILLLGERPDAPTLIGAAIVIGSGLFVLLRERALARSKSR